VAELGLRRSAVVLSTMLTTQFRRLAAASGVVAHEHHRGIAEHALATAALSCIVAGVEPVSRFSTMASTTATLVRDTGEVASQEVT
jgi:hypothetical protein